jgi:hypothetical protein
MSNDLGQQRLERWPAVQITEAVEIARPGTARVGIGMVGAAPAADGLELQGGVKRIGAQLHLAEG